MQAIQLFGTMYTKMHPSSRDNLLRLIYYIEYKEQLHLPASVIATYIFFINHSRFIDNLTNHCRAHEWFKDPITGKVRLHIYWALQ